MCQAKKGCKDRPGQVKVDRANMFYNAKGSPNTVQGTAPFDVTLFSEIWVRQGSAPCTLERERERVSEG